MVDAKRLLAAGDVRGAETRLRAARLTGQLNRGDGADLAKAIDDALDKAVPHRRAAIEALGMARVEYLRAQVAIGEAERLAAEIATARRRSPGAGSEGPSLAGAMSADNYRRGALG